MTRSLGARARRRAPRRTPAIATTLLAAALAGELAVGTLAPTGALAQTDESAPAEAHTQSDEQPPSDGSAEPPPEPPAADVDAPPAQAPPAESPPASAAPEAGIPVRSGYAPEAASEAQPAPMGEAAQLGSPRTGSEREAEPATSRTGHGSAERRASESRASGTPARDGRRAAPPRRSTRDATDRPRGAGSPVPRGDAGMSAGPQPNEHTVVAGEHLWGIAAARLAELTGRDESSLRAEEVAPYWTRLCMVNAQRLRSGDLNLVYPGEVIELPTM